MGKCLNVAELWKSYYQETQPCDTLGTYPKVLGSLQASLQSAVANITSQNRKGSF